MFAELKEAENFNCVFTFYCTDCHIHKKDCTKYFHYFINTFTADIVTIFVQNLMVWASTGGVQVQAYLMTGVFRGSGNREQIQTRTLRIHLTHDRMKSRTDPMPWYFIQYLDERDELLTCPSFCVCVRSPVPNTHTIFQWTPFIRPFLLFSIIVTVQFTQIST